MGSPAGVEMKETTINLSRYAHNITLWIVAHCSIDIDREEIIGVAEFGQYSVIVRVFGKDLLVSYQYPPYIVSRILNDAENRRQIRLYTLSIMLMAKLRKVKPYDNPYCNPISAYVIT